MQRNSLSLSAFKAAYAVFANGAVLAKDLHVHRACRLQVSQGRRRSSRICQDTRREQIAMAGKRAFQSCVVGPFAPRGLVLAMRNVGGTPGMTERDRCRGKIYDILSQDYPDFFKRPPNFDVYAADIIVELGRPFHQATPIRGKESYCRAFRTMQRIAHHSVSGGRVEHTIYDWKLDGLDLRVFWTCEGRVRLWPWRSVHVSGISFYSLGEQPLIGNDGGRFEEFLINRHTLEFVDIEPPRLRSLIMNTWTQHAGAPVHPVPAFGTAE